MILRGDAGIVVRMFEHFTDGARRVLVFAQVEAQGLHDSSVKEHLHMGMLREGEGVAARRFRTPAWRRGVRLQSGVPGDPVPLLAKERFPVFQLCLPLLVHFRNPRSTNSGSRNSMATDLPRKALFSSQLWAVRPWLLRR